MAVFNEPVWPPFGFKKLKEYIHLASPACRTSFAELVDIKLPGAVFTKIDGES